MHYDSFVDRTPTGALLKQTPVTFKLTAPEAKVATLLVSQADGDMQAVVMQPLGQQWLATITPDTQGLWYYAFRVETNTGQVTYGTVAGGFGGSGQVYRDPDAAPWYQLTVVDRFETVPDWYKNAQIYHIFVDRFNNGNPDGQINHPKPNSFLYGQLSDDPYYVKDATGEVVRWDFYGGNLAGITAKLDWLKHLGFDALYLSPIFEAASNHRYDTADYYRIDPMLGTLADFKALVSGLHRRGMHLILDGVFNHVGRDSRYFNALGHYQDVGAAQDPASPYAPWFTFKHWPDDYEAWWGVKDLPAIKKESAAFHEFIAGGVDSVIGYWTKLGVDGWRLDVVDELADDFLRQIRALLDQFPDRVLIGEVWEDASHKIAYAKRRPYLQGHELQGAMNYPQRQLMLDYVNGVITPGNFARQIETLKENYPPEVFAYNFTSISTHDTKRVLTALGEDRQKLAQLLTLWASLPGNLVQFYGDEAGLFGGVDPQNRKYYPWDRIDQALFSTYQKAWQQRRDPLFAGRAGFSVMFDGEGLGIVRYLNDQAILVGFNATDRQIQLDPKVGDTHLVPSQWASVIQPLSIAPHSTAIQPLTQP
ncbi:alpha-amylase family glycosyl hydrolase [Lacticaseibacillus sp. N501-2]|uniref:alpha-amylase family glycosyl hydrolase n=1 Tax=Lacticaseibacillus salsurae TaxID=3367729 RepID=UPI0038B40540